MVGTPKALATARSVSASRTKGSLYSSANFFCASTVSALTPITWMLAEEKSGKASRREHACAVQPGVPALG